MKAFFALVAREVNERKALIGAAAVASLLPLLAPLLPSTGTNPPEDIREAVMWVMVFGLIPLFALLLGVSFIGRDLAEDRLGFFFAQPISGPTIWFGKLAATTGLLWMSQVIIMLPTVLLSPEPLQLVAPKGPLAPYDPLWFTVLPLWLGPIGVMLLAHAVGTMWRSRSLWVIVDLVALLVVISGAWLLFRPFFFHYTAGVAVRGYLWLVSILLAALALGGAFQMTVGRVDLRRGHRALSSTVWSIVLVGVFGLGGWTWWIRSADLEDLSASSMVALGAGEWISVMGSSPGRVDYEPRFIVSLKDGRWLRADSRNVWDMRDMVIARDQSRAVWLSPITFGSSKFMIADLDARKPEGRESGFEFDVLVRDVALSDDGDRAAVIQNRTVMVFDLDSQAQLAAAQISGDFEPHAVSFEDRDQLRIETIDTTQNTTERARYQTRHFDIANKVLSNGDQPRRSYYSKTIPRVDGKTRVSFEDLGGNERRMILVDEDTGERLAELGRMVGWRSIRVVGDRLVVARWGREGERIEIFDGLGTLLRTIDLRDAGALYAGGQIDDDRLVVGVWKWGSSEAPSPSMRTMVIDVAAASGEVVLDGYAPVLGLWGNETSAGAWDVGTLASRVLKGPGDSLHLWDPETNELKQLIPVPD